MGRGFGWYQLPEDEAELFTYIAKRGDLVVTPFIVARRPEGVVEIAPVDFLTVADALGCAICVRGTLKKLGVAAFGTAADRSYGLPLDAEELSYRRVRFIDGQLPRCNLSANWQYLSEDKTALIDKSPEFRRWAGKIFDWARRHAPEKLEHNGYWYPATIRAAAAHRRGEFKVIG